MKSAQEIRLAIIAKIAPKFNASIIAASAADQKPVDRDMPRQVVGQALDFSSAGVIS